MIGEVTAACPNILTLTQQQRIVGMGEFNVTTLNVRREGHVTGRACTTACMLTVDRACEGMEIQHYAQCPRQRLR